VLFEPEAHEPLTDDPWSAERACDAIRATAADAEAAFDDGWLTHPADVLEEDVTDRFRTVHIGGAGVVDALRRLAERGLIEVERDYVPGRHTLWTGDLGTALYLADCLQGEGALPLP
jgi:hypothetical protein